MVTFPGLGCPISYDKNSDTFGAHRGGRAGARHDLGGRVASGYIYEPRVSVAAIATRFWVSGWQDKALKMRGLLEGGRFSILAIGRIGCALDAIACMAGPVCTTRMQKGGESGTRAQNRERKTYRHGEGGGLMVFIQAFFDAVLLVPHVRGGSVRPWTGFAAIVQAIFRRSGLILRSHSRAQKSEVGHFHCFKISQFLVNTSIIIL